MMAWFSTHSHFTTHETRHEGGACASCMQTPLEASTVTSVFQTRLEKKRQAGSFFFLCSILKGSPRLLNLRSQTRNKPLLSSCHILACLRLSVGAREMEKVKTSCILAAELPPVTSLLPIEVFVPPAPAKHTLVEANHESCHHFFTLRPPHSTRWLCS